MELTETKELDVLCLERFSNIPVNLRSADASCAHFSRLFQVLQLLYECGLYPLLLQCCLQLVQREGIIAQQNFD